MKKIFSLLICFALIFSCASCTAVKKGDGASQDVSSETTDGNSGNPSDPGSTEGKGLTFMVYMIGSDLESKSGAGTNDLAEMTESGVDTDKVNVIVYTGGAKKWHNDAVESDEDHCLLQLTAEGFETVATFEPSSMGESDSLTQFLNYSYENYPADEFALVMWDHGDGPVIGYGKDMLYDNDSLTLAEMCSALSESPFDSENKLSWVGFDACLMSSAELAVVWSDYADYMVASQEVEPAFGWNYQFLSEIVDLSTEELLKNVTATYLASCEEYFEDKGYEDREATLSCLNLSYAEDIRGAVNALFSKASDDIDDMYNELTVSRASTRALGRASTGSEYDIIDLADMAEQFSELYPEESEALLDSIEDMVVSNDTNADGLCGLSVFYPFYNKAYYEKTWGEVYGDLSVFDDYIEYLDVYSEVWLGNDITQDVATSTIPDSVSDSEFTLTLTDEQAETFVNAKFYILSREGKGVYTKIFSSQNVTLEDNVLYANFDGDIIYAKDDYGRYLIPVTYEHDKVGDITRYSAFVTLTNDTANVMLDLYPLEDYERERETESYRFQLSANCKTKEISIGALVPSGTSVSAESLVGGKLEDADLDEWTTYFFPQEGYRYIERDENGVVLPFDEWERSSYLSSNISFINDGIEFVFAPLAAGEYYLIFEIEDTQGNKYCSEPARLEADDSSIFEREYEINDVTWKKGSKVTLMDEEGVRVYLTTIDGYEDTEAYALTVKNENDFPVTVKNNFLAFDNVFCPGGYISSLSVAPGDTVTNEYGFDFGAATGLGAVDGIETLQFNLSVTRYDIPETIVDYQYFDVTLDDSKSYTQSELWPEFNSYNEPIRCVSATEQLIYDEDGFKIYLMGIGSYEDSTSAPLNGGIRYENGSDKSVNINIAGLLFDNVYVPCGGGSNEVPAGCTVYETIYISNDDLDAYGIYSASSVMI